MSVQTVLKSYSAPVHNLLACMRPDVLNGLLVSRVVNCDYIVIPWQSAACTFITIASYVLSLSACFCAGAGLV